MRSAEFDHGKARLDNRSQQALPPTPDRPRGRKWPARPPTRTSKMPSRAASQICSRRRSLQARAREPCSALAPAALISATEPTASNRPCSMIADAVADLGQLGENMRADRAPPCQPPPAARSSREARSAPAGRARPPARRESGPTDCGSSCGPGRAAASCPSTSPSIGLWASESSCVNSITSPIARSRSCPDEPVRAGKEIEVLQHVHVLIRAEIIGHESQPPPHAVGVIDHREAVDERIARQSARRASRESACWSFCPRRSARCSQTPRPRRLRTTRRSPRASASNTRCSRRSSICGVAVRIMFGRSTIFPQSNENSRLPWRKKSRSRPRARSP